MSDFRFQIFFKMNFQPNRTFNFRLGTSHALYRDGYQYETKPAEQGGREYAQLLFFPIVEGYVKALYPPNPRYNVPMAYQYIYIYKDHLGNNRLSYTLDTRTHHVKILEENNYYPFGLKHGNYNAIRKDVKYKEELAEKKEIKQVVPEAVKFKYDYQEQERQDELGLNWDSFKYRNYDYAIGRFMSVDPLAEKYPYNSTYAFQENKMGLGRELEGLELVPFLGFSDFITLSEAGEDISLDGVNDSSLNESPTNANEMPADSTVDTSTDTDVEISNTTDATDATSNNSQTDSSNDNDLSQTNKDRIRTGHNIEKAKNQLDGIEKAQDAAKKAQKGVKQYKIQDISKSKQNFKYALKRLTCKINIDDLNDLYSTQFINLEKEHLYKRRESLKDDIP